MKKIISGILYIVSLCSGILGSCIKDVANWWDIARPFYLIFAVTMLAALCLTYTNQIRRVSYPALVCACTWVYKHKILMIKFTRSAYMVYQANHCSYGRLFDYTQLLFDIYVEGLAEN